MNIKHVKRNIRVAVILCMALILVLAQAFSNILQIVFLETGVIPKEWAQNELILTTVIFGITAIFFGVIGSMIVMCGDMDFSFITIIVFIAVIMGLVVGNKVEKRHNHAVELYDNGQYEEAMDEFIELNDEEYLEKYTVYRLKGTDLVRESK